jgi:hypothetical protein
MPEPVFKVGDLVWVEADVRRAVTPSSNSQSAPRHIYEVVGWSSGEDGQVRYRLQGGDPSHRLVAQEGKLERATKCSRDP